MTKLERLLKRSIAMVNARKRKQEDKMEKCVVIQLTGEVFHHTCFDRHYPNKEQRPAFGDYNPQDDDECDYCAAPLIDPPDEDNYDDDDDDDDDDSEAP